MKYRIVKKHYGYNLEWQTHKQEWVVESKHKWLWLAMWALAFWGAEDKKRHRRWEKALRHVDKVVVEKDIS